MNQSRFHWVKCDCGSEDGTHIRLAGFPKGTTDFGDGTVGPETACFYAIEAKRYLGSCVIDGDVSEETAARLVAELAEFNLPERHEEDVPFTDEDLPEFAAELCSVLSPIRADRVIDQMSLWAGDITKAQAEILHELVKKARAAAGHKPPPAVPMAPRRGHIIEC